MNCNRKVSVDLNAHEIPATCTGKKIKTDAKKPSAPTTTTAARNLLELRKEQADDDEACDQQEQGHVNRYDEGTRLAQALVFTLAS